MVTPYNVVRLLVCTYTDQGAVQIWSKHPRMTGATQGRSKLQIIAIATFSTFILRQNTDKVTIPQTETILYTVF